MKKPKGFLHLKYEISVGRHDKTSPVVATGNLAMIVIWVIIENLLAVRALVDGSHAAKLSEAAPTDVLLDAQHQEIVSTRFQAEVVGFPGISALWALDARLIAILVPSHHSLGFLTLLGWLSIIVVIVVFELLRVGESLKSLHYDLESFGGNL